jgi:hypothetical protein
LRARGLGGDDRWPAAFRPYVGGNVGIYYCPASHDVAEQSADPYSNTHNNTTYIINGFNDIIPYNTPNSVLIDSLPNPSETILFGEEKDGNGEFYMDLVENNQNRFWIIRGIMAARATYLAMATANGSPIRGRQRKTCGW